MADDEGRDDATLAETLGAFGARPLLDGTSEHGDEPTHPEPGGRVDEGRTGPDEPWLGRLTAWVRWAAAPLGFFLFLSALTAYGVLRDREGSNAADSTARPVVATTAPPATTAPVPTSAAVPTTGLQAPTTLPEALVEPPATSPPVRPDPGPRVTPTTAPAPRFGPVCGYAPGQTVAISINGRPAPPVTADSDGCVSVRR